MDTVIHMNKIQSRALRSWGKAKRTQAIPKWGNSVGLLVLIVVVLILGYSFFVSPAPKVAPSIDLRTIKPITTATTTPGTTASTTAPVANPATVVITMANGGGTSIVPAQSVDLATKAAIAEITGNWTGVPLVKGASTQPPPAHPYAGASVATISLLSSAGGSYTYRVPVTTAPGIVADVQITVEQASGGWVFVPSSMLQQ